MTIERPMFPPRADSVALPSPETSRRAFLVKAAAAAAGGAAVGMALPLPKSAAGAGLTPNSILESIAPTTQSPTLTLDASLLGDELRSALGRANEAHEALKSAWSEYRRVQQLVAQWNRRNREPVGNSRAHAKFERRRCKYHEAVNYHGIWEAYQDAKADFERAKVVVARVEVRDLNELAAKAAAVWIFEDPREEHLRGINYSIALSVAVALSLMAARQTKGAAA